MKKLLHVALLITFGLVNLLNAEKISEESLTKLLDLSGITKQMQEYPAMVKSGMSQAKAQGSSIPDTEYEEMQKAVDKAYEPSKIITTIKISLKKNISQEDANNLLKWYESKIGKEITKVEEDSSTPEAYAYMLKNARSIMQDKKKVFFAKRIDKLLHVTEMVTELQKNTSISVYSTMNRPTKSEMAIFRSQISSQRKLIESRSEQMVILSFAYSYRDISDKNLQKYMTFLKEPSTKKFNDAAMSGMMKALNSAVSDMANSFAKISN